MSDNKPSSERDYLGKSLDVAIRLFVVAVIVVSSFRIFSAFLVPVVWGIIIAVALFPLFAKLKAGLGGRNRLAGTIFILVGLAAVLAPTIWLAESLIEGAADLGQQLDEGTLRVPPPSDAVKEWPLIGESLYNTWQNASVDLEATADKLAPVFKDAAGRFAGMVAGLGAALIQSIFALIIAGILMMTATGGDKTARAIARRLAGDDGPEMVDLAVGSIRSVVKGVLAVAMIQSLAAAVGLVMAGVPGAGLWAVLVLAVAVMQLPPILILGPIAIWLFSANGTNFTSIGFLVWSLIISGADGFLKPIFLGRGVKVPMLVILIGAIGGMMRSGVIGLFVGPVILAIAYQLFKAWVTDDVVPDKGVPDSESV